MNFYKNILGTKVRKGEKLKKALEKKITEKNLNIAELAKKRKGFDKTEKSLDAHERGLRRVDKINKKNKINSIRDRTILSAPAIGGTYLSYSNKKSDERLRES